MSGYTASFTPGGGLHPTLHLSISSTPAPGPSCALHTLVEVPQELIADRYQLSQLERDGRLGAAGGAQAVWHVGEGDLEAPAWRAGRASVLVRLSDGSGAGDEHEAHSGERAREEAGKARGESIEVDVPLHLRYQKPVERRWLVGGARADSKVVEVDVPWAFWACPAGAAADDAAPCPSSSLPDLASSFPHLASSTLHFLPLNVSLPPSLSSFSTCPPARPPPLVLVAPTGVLADLPLVEGVTAAAVWACFAFLCWTAVWTYRRGAVAGAGRGRKDKAA
ncbi:hypothetical protein JCM9279_000140 [Rhodotorula babjevae]